VSLNAV